MPQVPTMLCPSPKTFGLRETLPGEDIPEELCVIRVEQFATGQRSCGLFSLCAQNLYH
jgi:hypothetical protein